MNWNENGVYEKEYFEQNYVPNYKAARDVPFDKCYKGGKHCSTCRNFIQGRDSTFPGICIKNKK